MLNDRLRQAVAQALRKGTALAVCMLDLDGFKPVNDRLGHQAGDQVLVEVAHRLCRVVRVEDTVARLGGDEFVLLLMLGQKDSRKVVQRALEALEEPIWLHEKVVRISASIGIAFLDPSLHNDPEQLLRQADQAAYAAKRAGRNRFVVYPDECIGS